MEESCTDEAECSIKVANGRRSAGAIRSLVYARNLQLQCTRVLHETFLVHVLTYRFETMVWKEKNDDQPQRLAWY